MNAVGGKAVSDSWVKMGQIVVPDLTVPWMTSYAGPAFAVSRGDVLRLYVTGRDEFNQSRIGIVDTRIVDGRFEVLNVHSDPVFDLGEAGLFDESGVSYPWLVEHGECVLMYYVGWVAGGRGRFQNYLGLAVSTDGGLSFERNSRLPLLDRTEEEPYGSGSCAVWVEDDGWHMIYTAFEPWQSTKSGLRPCYRLKEAESTNGFDWNRTGRTLIDFHDESEHVIGKPMVLRDANGLRVWYSYRGESYRIGYAESVDGQAFLRRDDLVGIDISVEGWDSEMIEYAFVCDHRDERYMFYNGNQYGLTGLGVARLDN